MTSSLRARHLPRYEELGRLLLKHRHAIRIGEDGMPVPAGEPVSQDAEALVKRLEELGPTFVKLGQLLSTRSDLLPTAYLKALSRLQDSVAPLEPGCARSIVETELGVRISTAFTSFDDEAMASASLGEVHRAVLRDGRSVVVKVQRPGALEQVTEDLSVIDELAQFLERHSDVASAIGFRAMVRQFRRALVDELDYRVEAQNLRRMSSDLADYTRLVIPLPIDDYTNDKVLTMDCIEGRSIGALRPIGQTDIDGVTQIEDLFRAYLDQVFVHGFFHADPHPGNILITADGRLGLIDLGMVAYVSPSTQAKLLRLLFAVSDGRGEEAAEALEQLSEIQPTYDRMAFRREIGDLVLRNHGVTAASINAGSMLGEFARIASLCGLRPVPELTLLMKALLNLDEVARRLDPEFDPNVVVRAHAAELMRHQMLEELSPQRLLSVTLEAREFIEHLPNRLNKVMDSVAEGRFKLNIQGFDDPDLMRGFQKLANRVAVGVVIAALVVSAALFSGGRGTLVLGYPLLTIVFLGLAAIAAIWMALNVIRADVRRGNPEHGTSAFRR